MEDILWFAAWKYGTMVICRSEAGTAPPILFIHSAPLLPQGPRPLVCSSRPARSACAAQSCQAFLQEEVCVIKGGRQRSISSLTASRPRTPGRSAAHLRCIKPQRRRTLSDLSALTLLREILFAAWGTRIHVAASPPTQRRRAKIFFQTPQGNAGEEKIQGNSMRTW